MHGNTIINYKTDSRFTIINLFLTIIVIRSNTDEIFYYNIILNQSIEKVINYKKYIR